MNGGLVLRAPLTANLLKRSGGPRSLIYTFSRRPNGHYCLACTNILGGRRPLLRYKGSLLLTASEISVTNFSQVIGTNSRFIHNAGSNTNAAVLPAIIYDDADIYKLKAVNENKNRSGVYRWVNKVNGKSYVGSSVNLGRRFKSYYDFSYISKSKMVISKALIKNGYSNFILEILEYCDPSEAIPREQYYLDLLKPEYNVLLIAGSRLGYKHSPETIEKFKNRRFTLEHKTKLLAHLKSHNSSLEQKSKSGKRLSEYNKSRGQKIEVFDTLNNKTLVYYSIREAARAIGCVHSTIRVANKVFKETGLVKPIKKKRYIVKIIKED